MIHSNINYNKKQIKKETLLNVFKSNYFFRLYKKIHFDWCTVSFKGVSENMWIFLLPRGWIFISIKKIAIGIFLSIVIFLLYYVIFNHYIYIYTYSYSPTHVHVHTIKNTHLQHIGEYSYANTIRITCTACKHTHTHVYKYFAFFISTDIWSEKSPRKTIFYRKLELEWSYSVKNIRYLTPTRTRTQRFIHKYNKAILGKLSIDKSLALCHIK